MTSLHSRPFPRTAGRRYEGALTDLGKLSVEASPVMATSKERVERKLAAILAADVAGSARLMALDEVGTLRLLTAHREIMDSVIAEHGGRIVNTAGDSVLAEFPSAVDAVQCAVEAQERLARASESDPPSAAWSSASACMPAT